MRSLYVFSLLSIGLLVHLHVSAQLSVQSNQTVEWYVENVLLGEGVQASNITFNGQAADEVHLQCGYFQSNGSYVELESGLVLSSGDVLGVDVFGGGDSIFVGEQTSITVTDPQGGDPDLEDISGENINDNAVLEFDFIPTGDTLRFNYIFGSEEYPFYVNSFNDAFGFFISGPGISGPYSSPAGFPDGSVNIALVPGTNTPVTIDNVNNSPGGQDCPGGGSAGPCTNCEFYVDNCAIQDEALDGMTTVLEAFSLVECGQTYHIKLAIGDALDGAFDSAVFLQEGSFQSSLAISAGLFSSIGPDLDGVLYENCGFGTLSFTRSAGIDVEATISIELDGVAENGVDFSTIPLEFTFAPGDSVITFNVSAIIDNLPEGEEEVTLTITNTAVSECSSGTVTSQFTFIVADDPEPLTVTSQDYAIDCGEDVTLDISVEGGYGQYNYIWTPTLPNEQDPTVSPGVTTTYELLVTDTCNAVETGTSVTVTVPVYDEVAVEAVDEVELICLEETTLSVESVMGGDGTYYYAWYENGELLGDGPTLVYTGGLSSTVVLQVTDGCGFSDEENISIIVEEIPIVLTPSPDSVICLTESIPLSVVVEGGEPPYTYAWSPPEVFTSSFTDSPIESTVYTVAVTDLCGKTELTDIAINVSDVSAAFFMEPLGYYAYDLGNRSTTENADTLMYLWDFGDGGTSFLSDPFHQYFDISEHVVSLTATNEHGCVDMATKETRPPPSVYIPSSFSPNGDGHNDYFRIVSNELVDYELRIYDRWGREVFFSVDQSESWNGRAAQESEYYANNSTFIYRLRARAYDGERYELSGTITLFR